MYEHFKKSYPRNEYIPYVFYRIACSYLNQKCNIDNDQTNTVMALCNFQELMKQFPKSEYNNIANINVDICYEKLSGHEFNIGIFYYKKGNYTSALYRFLKIISSYPNSRYHYMAIMYLVNCENLIKES